MQEWYDYNMSLVRYDYKPNPSNLLNFGLDTLSEVHDWNEGKFFWLVWWPVWLSGDTLV